VSNIDHPTSINRDYIRLLQVMRRFIREEFCCNIHMTQEDAIEQLLHFSELSRNHVLQEMGKELRELAQQSPAERMEDGHEEHRTRYYRGAAVAINEKHNAKATETAPLVKGSKRIYRGQVIGG
jgi:hypothetical protein